MMITEHPVGLVSGIETSAPKMARLRFEWDGAALPEDAEWAYGWGISVVRPSALRIGVEFMVSIEDIPGLTAEVAYRMIFDLDPDSEEAKNAEHSLRTIAARLAPVAMYPFMREALVSAANRALVTNLILPIVYVGKLFTPEELEFPDAPAETEPDTAVPSE